MVEDFFVVGDVDSSFKKIKVMVVGDSGVGKICMLMMFVNDEFFMDGCIFFLYEGGIIKGKVYQVVGLNFKMIILELQLVNINFFVLWCKMLW